MMKTLDRDLILQLSRHEWLAVYTAYRTRTVAGRDLVIGLQVKKVRGGWVYGFASSPQPCCRPTAAEILYDMIRRTDLAYYVNEAEDYRIRVLMAV